MKTDCAFFKEDVGKNLYSKTTYYTVRIEQHVIAKDKDEADKIKKALEEVGGKVEIK